MNPIDELMETYRETTVWKKVFLPAGTRTLFYLWATLAILAVVAWGTGAVLFVLERVVTGVLLLVIAFFVILADIFLWKRIEKKNRRYIRTSPQFQKYVNPRSAGKHQPYFDQYRQATMIKKLNECNYFHLDKLDRDKVLDTIEVLQSKAQDMTKETLWRWSAVVLVSFPLWGELVGFGYNFVLTFLQLQLGSPVLGDTSEVYNMALGSLSMKAMTLYPLIAMGILTMIGAGLLALVFIIRFIVQETTFRKANGLYGLIDLLRVIRVCDPTPPVIITHPDQILLD